MGILSIINPPARPQSDDLETLLTELSRYGKPRVGMYGTSGGWHCSVEMDATATGVRFQVDSEFRMATPTEAAKQCRDRMHEAIKKIKGDA